MRPARQPDHRSGQPAGTPRPALPRLALGLVAAVAFWCVAAPAIAADGPSAPAAPGARTALEAVARAWQAEDHVALSALVAEEGIEIAIAAQTGARNHYSGRQAFYYFKNLFRTTETDAFRFSLFREDPDVGLVQAVADWSYRRAGADGAQDERLFFTLKQAEAKWGLTAIRAVR